MNINTKHALTEHEHFCFDCKVVQDGLMGIDTDNQELIKECTEICDKCISGSEWQERLGDKRFE